MHLNIRCFLKKMNETFVFGSLSIIQYLKFQLEINLNSDFILKYFIVFLI